MGQKIWSPKRMKSVVICGSVDKEGLLVGPLRNNQDISKNTWEFKLVSLTLIAKTENISGIFEIGCSLNASETYDYAKKRYTVRNSTLCVKNVKISKGDTVTYEFGESFCPFFRVETVKDRIEVSMRKAGQDTVLSKNSADFVYHIIMRRISWTSCNYESKCSIIVFFFTYYSPIARKIHVRDWMFAQIPGLASYIRDMT